VRSAASPALSVAIAMTNGSCGYCAGLPVGGAPDLDLRQRRVLEALDEHPVALDELGEQLLDGRLLGDRVLADLARRRFDATTTSNAPAWRWRHESLPSWSMSNS
jgi:hypothetical protein